jgi:hypothetical protein
MMTCEAFGELAQTELGVGRCLNMERRDTVFDHSEPVRGTVFLGKRPPLD